MDKNTKLKIEIKWAIQVAEKEIQQTTNRRIKKDLLDFIENKKIELEKLNSLSDN